MPKRRKAPTVPELQKSIRETYKRWGKLKRKGGTDPFWPDGTNMNLVRNHVFYYQIQLRDLCKAEGVRPCPKEARLKPPPAVSENYMAPGSKSAKHYTFSPLKRRPVRKKRK